MADGVSVKVEGIRELRAQILAMSKILSPDLVEPILLKGAETVAAEARRRAPVGPGSKKHGPGGVLRRSIVAKTLRRRGESPAPSIAALDRRLMSDTMGANSRAPHAHMVEFGTNERIGKKRTKGERDYTGRRFGIMPAKPFLRPAFDSKKREVLEQITRDLGALVDRGVNQP